MFPAQMLSLRQGIRTGASLPKEVALGWYLKLVNYPRSCQLVRLLTIAGMGYPAHLAREHLPRVCFFSIFLDPAQSFGTA